MKNHIVAKLLISRRVFLIPATGLFLFACFLFLASFSFAVADNISPRIIIYHRVGDDRYPSANVSTQAFRAQMSWLKDHGYSVISTMQLEKHLREGVALPDKAVAIHFDDGYKSVHANAYPILSEFGYDFTLFLPTDALDGNYGDYISWQTARDMIGKGASFGFHGKAHERLGTPRKGEAAEAYSLRLKELFSRGSIRMLENGLEARWVAYPYGEYGPELLSVAEAVFKLGFSQDPGAVGAGSNHYAIPRFAVVGSLSDMSHFVERMTYSALNLKELNPFPGRMSTSPPKQFSAEILDWNAYEKGSENLFVSEIGRLDAFLRSDDGKISAVNDSVLKRRLNRVIISVRERNTGRYALGSWLIINPEGI